MVEIGDIRPLPPAIATRTIVYSLCMVCPRAIRSSFFAQRLQFEVNRNAILYSTFRIHIPAPEHNDNVNTFRRGETEDDIRPNWA